MTIHGRSELRKSEQEERVFRSVESIKEGMRDKRLQQVSFALG